ncbi:hypothetical protein GGX14DRAFT_584168 [Mycena pura]|uniref:Uncharacterized protein n=1 Tax=Mycena pura TaxID=153505 RepID=A0AAD6YVV3_9AGAR|nr:hypothetical protein GGX14DRAFT_584168 [Mycena pura]
MDATEVLTLSRRASVRGRPQAAPMGPRTRNSSRNSSMILAGPQAARESSPYTRSASPRYSAPSQADRSDSKTLSSVTEHSYEAPLLPEDAPSPPPTPHTPMDEPLSVKPVLKVAGLTPTPQIKFESAGVDWKGLPLEAALWTLDSTELQDLVSRAIRNSSHESAVRILSVKALDEELPAELDRLNTQKSVTQSKYRFTVHRRTMLLQALHSFSSYNDKEKDTEVIAELTSQLSQTTAECDQLLENLLQIADQVGQITRLQDVHWASALAIALRKLMRSFFKLNGSYGRRTSDLLKARDRIATLEAELNDAWQEAEKLAREMDEFDAEIPLDDEGEAVIEVAEVISLKQQQSSPASPLSPRSFADVLSLDALSRIHSETTSPISPVMFPGSQTTTIEDSQLMSKTPPSPAPMQLPLPFPSQLEIQVAVPDTPRSPSKAPPQAFETTSIYSTRSANSTTRSQGSMDTFRVNMVSAARQRSVRTSMGSLRMPSIKSRKGSHPPVPSFPSVSSASSVSHDRTSKVESFLDFGSRDTDSDTDDADAPVTRRRTSIDDIEVAARTLPLLIETRDDIHVMPSRSAAERELVTPRRSQFSLDHQHPFAIEEPTNHSIPSIWLLQETPKTPAERVDSMMRERGHVKMGSLQRFKSLTKRYSLPFPTTARSKSNRSALGS